MQIKRNLSLTRLLCIRQCAQHEALQGADIGRRGVDDVLAVLHFAVEGDFVGGAVLLGGLFVHGGVLDELPEVGVAENDGGAGEGGFDGFDVVEVAGDHFDAFGGPFFGGWFGGVAGYAADFVDWVLEEDVGY